MSEPRTVSRSTFSFLSMMLSVTLVIVVAGVAAWLTIVWRIRVSPIVIGTLAVLVVLLSRAAADRILHRLGLSRSGTTFEVHVRSPFESCDDGPPIDLAEARVGRRLETILIVGLPLLLLFCVAGMWRYEKGSAMWWLAAGLGGYLLIQAVAFLLEYGEPQARVDADGVTGYPSHRAILRRFVPWTDVFGCEVRTVYDTLGEPIMLRPILKGRHGETLMTLMLHHTPMVEQVRVVRAIKARLPETEIDSWPVG